MKRLGVFVLSLLVTVHPAFATGASCFQRPVIYRTQTDKPLGPGAVGDFNNDGNADLAVPFDGACNQGGSGLYIFLGDGKGAFKPTRFTGLNGSRFGVADGDFNGDGKLDLAATYSDQCLGGSRQLEVALGNGDGTFQLSQFYSDGLTVPSELVTADFNGDGKLDLLVPDIQDRANFMFLGNGDGTFQHALKSSNGSGNNLVVADFNHDEKMDVASAISAIQIKLGNGDGSFGQTFTYRGGEGQAIGDLNGDGNLDVVTSLLQPLKLVVYLGNGDGTLTQGSTYPSYDAGSILMGNFNGDSNLDVVVVSGNFPWRFTLLRGPGDGTLAQYETVSLPFQSLGIAAADVNHDGRPDLILQVLNSRTQVAVYLNSGQCQ